MGIVLASVLFLIVACSGIDRKRHIPSDILLPVDDEKRHMSPDILLPVNDEKRHRPLDILLPVDDGKRHALPDDILPVDGKRHKEPGPDDILPVDGKRHKEPGPDDILPVDGKRHEVPDIPGIDEKRHQLPDNPHKLSEILRELIGYYQVRDDIYTTTASPTPEPESSTSEPRTRKFDEGKLEDLQTMFMMPGSYYFFELIHTYCMVNSTVLDPNDIIDYFELPDCHMKEHCKEMVNVFRETQDSDGTALMEARHLTKMIFVERMKCPANVIDHAIARMMLRERKLMMETDHDSMLTFFKTMAPKIDRNLAAYADELAYWAADQLHGRVFNDTMMLVMAYGLRDVALTSHYIFYYMKYYLDHTSSPDPETMQYIIAHSTWNVTCPTYEETVRNHQKVFGTFLEQFETLETGKVCSTVYDLLHEFIRYHIPGYNPTYTVQELEPVCDRIHEWIFDVLKGYKEYEDGLYSLDMGVLGKLLRDSLGEDEWLTVRVAALKLGLQPMGK